MPHSGWPFGRATLDPFYARAAVYCEIGAPLFDAATALPDRPAALLPGFDSPAVTATSIERFSRPTDFGRLLEAGCAPRRRSACCSTHTASGSRARRVVLRSIGSVAPRRERTDSRFAPASP
ncbi:MAG: hypothetical protein WDO24_23720 [Pseudomonadota bacterium]